jgi:predicted NAD/FAD-binding protein
MGIVSESLSSTMTLKEFIDTIPFLSQGTFKTQYLYPVLAAPWGLSLDTIPFVPVLDVGKWYVNHKLDTLSPTTWNKVSGGCQVYTNRLNDRLTEIGVIIKTSSPVTVVTDDDDGKHVRIGDKSFDALVLACPANIAHTICQQIPTVCPKEVTSALGAISYQSTRKTVHTNTHLMDKDPSKWGTYNIQFDNGTNTTVDHMWYGGTSMSTTDDNPTRRSITGGTEYTYEHVVPNVQLLSSRDIVRKHRGLVAVAGSYLVGDSFHEAAVDSAVQCVRNVMTYLKEPAPSRNSLLYRLKSIQPAPLVDSLLVQIFNRCVDYLTLFMYRIGIV